MDIEIQHLICEYCGIFYPINTNIGETRHDQIFCSTLLPKFDEYDIEDVKKNIECFSCGDRDINNFTKSQYMKHKERARCKICVEKNITSRFKKFKNDIPYEDLRLIYAVKKNKLADIEECLKLGYSPNFMEHKKIIDRIHRYVYAYYDNGIPIPNTYDQSCRQKIIRMNDDFYCKCDTTPNNSYNKKKETVDLLLNFGVALHEVHRNINYDCYYNNNDYENMIKDNDFHSFICEIYENYQKIQKKEKNKCVENMENMIKNNIIQNKEAIFRFYCSYGYFDEVKLFFELNSDLNIHSYWDEAFRMACANGHLNIVKWLYEISLERNSPIRIGICENYDFYWSCYNGNLDCALWLWEIYYKEKNDENYKNFYCQLFKESFKNNKYEVSKCLYEICNLRNLPLIKEMFGSACTNGNFDFIKWYLENEDIDFYEINEKKDPFKREHFFSKCCYSGNVELIKWLLEKYPNLNFDISQKNFKFNYNNEDEEDEDDDYIYLYEFHPFYYSCMKRNLNICYFFLDTMKIEDETLFSNLIKNILIDLPPIIKNYDIVKLLIDIYINRLSVKFDFNEVFFDLCKNNYYDNFETIKYLWTFKEQLNINLNYSKDSNNIFTLCSLCNNSYLMEWIYPFAEELNIYIRFEGDKVLFNCCNYDNIKVFLFMSNIYDQKKWDYECNKLFQYACEHNSINIAKYLYNKHKENIDFRYNNDILYKDICAGGKIECAVFLASLCDDYILVIDEDENIIKESSISTFFDKLHDMYKQENFEKIKDIFKNKKIINKENNDDNYSCFICKMQINEVPNIDYMLNLNCDKKHIHCCCLDCFFNWYKDNNMNCLLCWNDINYDNIEFLMKE
jgi:hypothetical protein